MPGLSAADSTKATQLSLKSGERAPVSSGKPALSSGTSPAQQYDGAAAKHLAAVAQSLAWAEESAARGDYADALGWIGAVQATGSQMHSRPSATRGSSHSRTAAARKGRRLIYDRIGPRDEREWGARESRSQHAGRD